MKKLVLLTCLYFIACLGHAQDQNVGAKLNELTLKWDQEASKLSTYKGLTEFCTVEMYRKEIIGTLGQIHHYDSVLYETIAKKARFGNDAELNKTLKDIEKVASTYSIRSFLVFLQNECIARNDIEKNAKQTGEDKDAEVYILETELGKYVKHITKRIDVIREHVHHLNIK